jgi:3'(2'), 5'-bisphosphate nucleotidase
MWTLDPIDGTKGFLRGGQYAVCLALLVDARVELGVIGCPNLPFTFHPPPPPHHHHHNGTLFVAVRGQGAHQLPLSFGTQQPQQQPQRLEMPRLALSDLSLLESVEKAHAALDTNARVAARLGVSALPVRMDSQAKYAALARGDAGGGLYLRLPVPGRGYQEKIWVRLPFPPPPSP